MADRYDLCVIGAGPGGFAAATRAAQRGARVVLVHERELGGTCLNTGCIPARALGATAALAGALARGHRLGIHADGWQVVWPDAVARKDRIVQRLREGLKQLAQARKIELVAGRGVLAGEGRVEVTPAGGGAPASVQAAAVIVATGSAPAAAAAAPVDGQRILSSDDLLRLAALPKRLLILGGGVIGCEFASYLAPLGVEVVLMEQAGQLLPGQDRDIAQAFEALLTKASARVQTQATVTGCRVEPRGVAVAWSGGPALTVDQVLVTVGRRPNTASVRFERVGVTLSPSGHVPVDDHLQTAAKGVYAVGDILGRHQTAYTASYEGAIAAENALGASRVPSYAAVPDCVFTLPEIASVGLTEAQAAAAGFPAAVSRLPWGGSARAMTLEETEGFIKVVYQTTTHRLLGVQMLGPRATDLIAEAALAVHQGLTLEGLVEIVHGHPTLSEALWEASAQPLARALYAR